MLGVKANNILWTELQWAKIKLGNNIAYSHKEWQIENTDNWISHIVLCHCSRFFMEYWFYRVRGKIDPLLMFSKIDLILIGRAGGFKILGSQNKTEIKAEFANLFSAPPGHCSRCLGCTCPSVCQSKRRNWRWNIKFDFSWRLYGWRPAWFETKIQIRSKDFQVYIYYLCNN